MNQPLDAFPLSAVRLLPGPIMDRQALNTRYLLELDPDRRREIVWQMQQIAFDDVVYIIPYYQQAIQAYRVDRFTGWIEDQAKVELSDVSSLLVIEPVR